MNQLRNVGQTTHRERTIWNERVVKNITGNDNKKVRIMSRGG